MKYGRKLLHQLGELAPREMYSRTHNLMTTGPGAPALKWGRTNIHAEDASGNPIYDDRIEDLIFDTYLNNGLRPAILLDSMPQVMSTNSNPYVHEWRPGMHEWRRGIPYDVVFTDLAYPPKVDGNANVDFYRFETTGPGTSAHYLEIQFAHSTGDLDMALYDGVQTFLADSTSSWRGPIKNWTVT